MSTEPWGTVLQRLDDIQAVLARLEEKPEKPRNSPGSWSGHPGRFASGAGSNG